MIEVEYRDFRGGINGLNPRMISQAEATSSRGFLCRDGVLETQKGMRKLIPNRICPAKDDASNRIWSMVRMYINASSAGHYEDVSLKVHLIRCNTAVYALIDSDNPMIGNKVSMSQPSNLIDHVYLSGVNPDNSDNGTLYVRMRDDGTNYIVSFYKSPGGLEADKVASGATSRTIDSEILLSEVNSSGICARIWLNDFEATTEDNITMSAKPMPVFGGRVSTAATEEARDDFYQMNGCIYGGNGIDSNWKWDGSFSNTGRVSGTLGETTVTIEHGMATDLAVGWKLFVEGLAPGEFEEYTIAAIPGAGTITVDRPLESTFVGRDFMSTSAVAITTPKCGSYRIFNNRVYAWRNSLDPSTYYLSDLGNAEAYNTFVYNSERTGAEYISGAEIGVNPDDGEPIVNIIAEPSSYGDTGIEGSSVLIQKISHTWRFSGYDWASFDLNEAFSSGTYSDTSCINMGGRLVWCDNNGLRIMNPGSGSPDPLPWSNKNSDTLYPKTLYKEFASRQAMAFYDNYLFLSFATDRGDGAKDQWNSELVIIDATNNSWMLRGTDNPRALCFTQYQVPYENSRLFAGSADGFIYELHSGETWGESNHAHWTTGTTDLGQSGWLKRIKEIMVYFDQPEIDQDITVGVIADGEEVYYQATMKAGSTSDRAVTVPVSAEGNFMRFFVGKRDADPGFTVPVTIRGFIVKFRNIRPIRNLEGQQAFVENTIERQDKYVRWSPEFDGAVFWLDPDTTGEGKTYSDNGILTAGFDAFGNHNAYRWEGNEPVPDSRPGEICIIAKIPVPEGFRNWINCGFWAKVSAGAGANTTVRLSKVIDSAGTQFDVNFSIYEQNSAWMRLPFVVPPTGQFFAGGWMTLVFRLTAAAPTETVRSAAYLGELEMDAY
jgi:hypothetical protein